ncbi:MAG: Uma2 family endonuclease [Caldilineaceae bacterium]|jgi:Uma2 family endonuclease|nr:Uma2 family endonuclease [Caldilineaceae bacterium]
MQTVDRSAPQADEWAEPAWDVALLFPAQGAWSMDEYLRLETNRLVEFSHGSIEVLPMPSDRHQSIVAYIFSILLAYAQQTGGKVLFAPFRLQLWPGKLREPDLVFLAAADDPRRDDAFWTGADLVVEVVSPDDPHRDLVTKRFEYARAGIPEYWIVDPRDESITVLHLADEQSASTYAEHGRFSRDDMAVSPSFEKLAVDVTALFDAA